MALNNIAKHAGARGVVITLEASAGELVLRVRTEAGDRGNLPGSAPRESLKEELHLRAELGASSGRSGGRSHCDLVAITTATAATT